MRYSILIDQILSLKRSDCEKELYRIVVLCFSIIRLTDILQLIRFENEACYG